MSAVRKFELGRCAWPRLTRHTVAWPALGPRLVSLCLGGGVYTALVVLVPWDAGAAIRIVVLAGVWPQAETPSRLQSTYLSGLAASAFVSHLGA